jgi:hypothetical protein
MLQGESNRLETIPSRVATLFLEKYDWRFTGDETKDALVEIMPTMILYW